MISLRNKRTLRRWAFLPVLAFLVGCRPAEQVRVYEVPKQPVADAAVPPGADSPNKPVPSPTRPVGDRPNDRMLALLVTKDSVGWSFKLVGKLEEISNYADAFRVFVESLKFADPKAPTWELPKGWEQLPPAGMRYATLLPNPPAKQPEISVVVLPPQDVLSNVNRWRKQMQLEPVSATELDQAVERITIDQVEAVLVDIQGTLSADAMMPPFMAQGQGGTPPFAAPATMPTPPAAPADAAMDLDLSYEAPASWQVVSPGPMQLRLFRISQSSTVAEVSIATLPIAGADLLANVNRWQAQIGSESASEEELSSLVRDREIGGAAAKYVDLPGPSSPDGESIIAAICHRGETAWFVKLKGPRELVREAQPQFDEFLDSIKWK